MTTLPIPLGWRIESAPDVLSTGVADCPRGRITEVIGPESSGRTSFLHSILAASTKLGEHAVLVDTNNAFDPSTAAAAGTDLSKMIWVRCAGNVEHAMRATDLVIQSGGFGVVALDLANAAESGLNRIPATTWFRWRRSVEATPTVLAVVARRAVTKSCSAVLVEMRRKRAIFTGNLLRGAEYEMAPRKPIGKEGRALRCAAV
jgi:recombination protein RecA